MRTLRNVGSDINSGPNSDANYSSNRCANLDTGSHITSRAKLAGSSQQWPRQLP